MPQTSHNTKQRPKLHFQEPDQYSVIMHNDDFTTMEFVVKVLKTVFFKQEVEATTLMLTVHKKGQATVGTYPLDIAASKCQKAMLMAQEEGFPFKVTYQKK